MSTNYSYLHVAIIMYSLVPLVSGHNQKYLLIATSHNATIRGFNKKCCVQKLFIRRPSTLLPQKVKPQVRSLFRYCVAQQGHIFGLCPETDGTKEYEYSYLN